MALRGLVKATDFQKIVDRSSVVNLYRSMIRELPRVMTIYDVDMPVPQARKAVRWHFDKNIHLKDGKVIGLLLAKGYMELEETLMQWKQKTHLMRVLDPMEMQDEAEPMSEREKLIRVGTRAPDGAHSGAITQADQAEKRSILDLSENGVEEDEASKRPRIDREKAQKAIADYKSASGKW